MRELCTAVLESVDMTVENIVVDTKRVADVIEDCLAARKEGVGVYEDVSAPEQEYISHLMGVGNDLGDERFSNNALFFTTSMVFAESTERLFERISSVERLKEYAWIFQPEIAIRVPSLEDETSAFFNPRGYNSRSIEEWHHNSRVLVDKYDGDVRNFYEANENDALKIVKSLEGVAGKKKEGLRRFGKKLSRLIVQWVNQYDLYPLDNVDQIGIPVDFQVARILVQTGGVELGKPVTKHNLNEKTLTPYLTELCLEYGWEPREVSEALYTLGNRGCNKRRHDQCPVQDRCSGLISRRPYDKKGLIDPKIIESLE